ncbi:E3 ubiquitin ligase BIG BROTHER-related-like [Andrographis paniculata]|uniref:E3 ubiquitin ligase BIG BROTHER-related-like n=1 Tax=Andrographis paniculata TaxID=175694 RepID=UPI0021E96419|nr:E3 ubiquitin ligase BIG BROTHER-related-like [Andrographis paniculata]XP_051121145.1 E3 ubiquitin ligase BIG BROTHER-related-like [Andrographis paniculata]XP_051121147.1 E3 ubiquitin ligase BIG BROTHER-related-like [Andrographis paniculata]
MNDINNLAEHLKDIYPEYGDLDAEEVLLMQESAFLYIEHNKQKGIVASDSGETSNSSFVLTHESESSSYGASVDRQLALDEDFARALELGEDFNNLYDRERDDACAPEMISVLPTETTAGSTSRETVRRVESRNITQDDIDPDRMTYEELQSLAEAVGSENRGLTPHLISRLPTCKYKLGLFSKKKKRENDECVICYSNYKNGEKVTTLPCVHRFHYGCITPWLRQNKQCPICQKEVQDE